MSNSFADKLQHRAACTAPQSSRSQNQLENGPRWPLDVDAVILSTVPCKESPWPSDQQLLAPQWLGFSSTAADTEVALPFGVKTYCQPEHLQPCR